MLANIRRLLLSSLSGPLPAQINEEQKRLACAALLIEVAIADQEFDPLELICLQRILASHFAISEADSNHYIRLAQQASQSSVSLQEFTRIVNQACNPADKFDLVVGMWQIAYADGELDKYEDYLIRKVADLIYLPQGEFIRAKHVARTTAAL